MNAQTQNIETPVVPKIYKAGIYWIGDLCYLRSKNWDNFCAATIVGDECLNGDFSVDGIDTWHHSTAYGDGSYPSNLGMDFSVDSGLIGLVKAEYAKDVRPGLGHFLEIKNDFVPTYEDGIFNIGPLRIDTESSEEDYW